MSFYLTWFLSLSALGAISITSFVYFWVDFASVRELKEYQPPIPSKLYDRKGRLITAFFSNQRIMIDIADMPPRLGQAFIAMEDNNFYQHYGIDPGAIFRAFLKNLTSGGIKQGGSTITQQLSKVVLTDRSRTYVRKVKEAFLSLYMDMLYEKDEILNMYFNQIYFGHGTYGVEAASNFYFKKSAAELTLGEAAILASLPSAPNKFSPVKNPHLSREKVVQVLLKMIDMGFIGPEEAAAEYETLLDYYINLNISPMETAFGRRVDNAPYFTEYMRQLLEKEFGKETLYEKGLNIYTSLDLDHQRAAQNALWRGLTEQTERSKTFAFFNHLEFATRHAETAQLASLLFDLPPYEEEKSYGEYQSQLYFHRELAESMELLSLGLGGEYRLDLFLNQVREGNPYREHIALVQGAFIEIDHMTGEVTAMVGGTPFNATNQINRAIQMKRQPGSTFKPILYAAAIDSKKITAASLFPDTPNIFLDVEGDHWIPENYSGGYRGFVTIREALTHSINMISIGVAREVGIRNMLPSISKHLHVPEKEIPANLTLALGSYEVSPIQMARAFSVFPRGGEDVDLVFVLEITDAEGNPVEHSFKADKSNGQVLQKGTAAVMTSLLQGVIEDGTGRKVRSVGYQGFAAGKTGTTNNFRDAWFVGFNDRYTSAVWVGYDKPTVSLGPGQAGGNVAAPIWSNFQYQMASHRKEEEPYLVSEEFVETEVCKENGELPDIHCEETIIEYFLEGTNPGAIVFDPNAPLDGQNPGDGGQKGTQEGGDPQNVVDKEKDGDSQLQELQKDDFSQDLF